MRRKVLALGLGLLAALLVAEVVLRFVIGNAAQARLTRPSEAPGVCLELVPGADLTYTGWWWRVRPSRMRVNSRGGRGPEPAERAAGRLRVIALGDSFTFGQGVEEVEALPAVLEDELRAAGLSVEVLNHGVPGHAPPQSVALLRERLLALRPDVVLLQVFANDLDPAELRCGYDGGAAERGGRGGPGPLERWVRLNVYSARFLHMLGEAWRRSRPSGDDAGIDAEATSAPTVDAPALFVAALRELERLAAAHDFEAAVVLLTDAEAVAHRSRCPACPPPHALVGQTEVHVIDLGPAWRRLFEDERASFIPGEQHWTAAGTRAMARALAAELRRWPALRERATAE